MGVPAGAGGGSHGVPAGRVGGWRFTWGPCWGGVEVHMGSLLGGWAGGGSHGVPAGAGWRFTWGPCWAGGRVGVHMGSCPGGVGVHMGSLLGGWVAGRLGFLSHGVVGVSPALLSGGWGFP